MKKLLIIPLILLATVAYTQQGQRISIRDFSGGLNTRMSPNQLPRNQASELKNLLVDEKPGSLVTRKGYSLASSTNATELFEYKKSNGQVFLVKHYQGTVEYSADAGNTWRDMVDGLKWELNPLRATVFDDYLLLSNGIDDVIVFDGSNTSEHSFIPHGKYLIPHYNRLFIANTWEDPNRIYYNVIGEDVTSEDAWESLNYEVVGGNITGLATYRDQLIIFTESETWALLGNSPRTWRLVKINTNYGCVQHESIAIDKGILKFLSKSGVMGYNGSSIVRLDFPVADIVSESNNLSGGYNYIIYNRTRDFNVDSSTGIETTLNEIKLNEYENEWQGSDLNVTLNSVSYQGSSLRLSTSTQVELTTYERSADSNEWYIGGFFNLIHLDDGNENSYSENDDKNWIRSGLDYSVSYSEPYSIRKINIKADVGLQSYLNLILYGKSDKSPAQAQRNARGRTVKGIMMTSLFADVVLTYEDGSKETYIDRQRITTWATPSIESGQDHHKMDTWGWPSTNYKYFYRYEGTHDRDIIKDISFNIDLLPQKIVAVTISFYVDGYFRGRPTTDWFIEPAEAPGSFDGQPEHDHKFRISKIYNTEMKYTDEQSVYEASGTFELDEQEVADTTVEFGSMTVYGRWGDEWGTDVSIQTKSDNDADWVNVTLDTSTLDTRGYAMGVVNSVAGNSIAVKGTLSTTISTQTPRINSIYIDSVEQSGSITLEPSQISKVNGGWSYFISRIDEDISQPITYYVRLGTSSDDIENSTYTAIETTDLIPGTTDQVWIQFKVDKETDNGTQNPKTYGLTAMYIPEQAPVYSSGVSIGDRYHLALSTSGTENNIVLVQDKNQAWTKYDIPVRSFTELDRDHYFSNENGIFKMYDGTDDAGEPIESKYEKVIAADFSFDHRLSEIITTGQNTEGGALNISYSLANSTISYTASNIDNASEGRFRHRQPSGGIRSAVQDWTVVYKSTSPFEVNVLELWPEVIQEFSE